MQLLHRRDFLLTGATGVAGMVLSNSFAQGAPVDSGSAKDGKVAFPTEIMPTEPSVGDPENPLTPA